MVGQLSGLRGCSAAAPVASATAPTAAASAPNRRLVILRAQLHIPRERHPLVPLGDGKAICSSFVLSASDHGGAAESPAKTTHLILGTH